MWCAVNPVTTSGRVAGPDQRISAEDALRGVNIEAAYSLKLENELGSIVPGKRANLTILEDIPLSVDPMKIKDIKVWGTVMEGRRLPAGDAAKKASLELSQSPRPDQENELSRAALGHELKVAQVHH
jgi:adenine deaminase